MSEPLFKTDCPSCGAPVHAHSATAVTLVCGYCNSMLVRHDDSIADTGRDSALLEDFSPLQIGTTGKFSTQDFTLIGRLQVRYDEGMWNEWYALFADGTTGWLSEAGDRYVFTQEIGNLPADTPEFDSIRAGFSTLTLENKKFLASDVRTITLKRSAAQGELPFELKAESVNRVADWRWEHMFLTLDYAQKQPLGFLGKGVTLDELHLANTRSDDQINQAAGSLKGVREAENCPNCGSPVQWVSGLTDLVICPSCGSELDTSGGKAELIQANTMRKAQEKAFTLPLGSRGKINNKTYTVIGALRKDELEGETAFDALYGKAPQGFVPQGSWFEYLLYHPQAGFLWLLETSEGEWSLSETLDVWPRLDINGQPQGCPKLYDYGGRVNYAAGAFYWHIRQGDINYYSDYKQGHEKLSAEYSPNELAWSKSTPVGYRQIAEWFNLPDKKPEYTEKMQAEGASEGALIVMLAVLVFVNLPAVFVSEDFMMSVMLLGVGAYLVFHRRKEEGVTMAGFVAFSVALILLITFVNYMMLADTGGSSGYIGGSGSGGFSGGHK
ncbi:DUF4178 domain-containing protein [Neisseria wadsworthii]|uniref:DUF4178 domain-containing protein n=1 Tax=Neisseria wadsworthii 9715 TaxID=1030841 RepID=G4CTV8_9NEIS|nr:DUF4178 domain-containing protein [Neisseria wadsworthii]EGZ43879.1 hypothetical protein HMPREF9370_2518 [Neisseria wadsworthii 9715]QMT36078.1 DUF4178 domain-containing protein [Neisseria wadsworthii]